MVWLSCADAARVLGISPRTVRNRFAVGTLERNSEGLYWVDANEPAPRPGVARPKVESAAVPAYERPAVRPDTESGFNSKYVYDESRQRYIFSLRSRPGKAFVVAQDIIETVTQAYSRDGGDATINEIARAQGWHRSVVREILRALGKTHDSLPYTDEEISRREEADLIEDGLRLKEQKVYTEVERRSYARLKQLAAEAEHFERFVARRLGEIIATQKLPPIPAVERGPSTERNPFTIFCHPTDLHYGKAGWRDEVGDHYDRDECRRRLLATTQAMLERVALFGAPEKFVIGAGGDWFHIDTDGGTTTRGTPQDADGSWARVFFEGSELACEYVEMLRQVAPVQVVFSGGNHDLLSSIMLVAWLGERYKGCTDVEVIRSVQPRQYVEVGQTLVGVAHGDGAKDAKLPNLMAVEAREAWGRTRHRIWFSGHIHTAQTNEYFGSRVIHMPSLAGTDRWHSRQGYVGNRKALSAYVIDHSEGLIADLPVSAR